MIDPNATTPLTVRCLCPPNPDGSVRHPDGDTVRIRAYYGYGDALALAKAGVQYRMVVHEGKPAVVPYTDAFLQEQKMVELGVQAWTIEQADGTPLPLDLSTILLLPPDVGEQVSEAINAAYEACRAPVPNGSGAPSPLASPENTSARPNRATRRSKKHSTPSSN